jgi:hypothetical protein
MPNQMIRLTPMTKPKPSFIDCLPLTFPQKLIYGVALHLSSLRRTKVVRLIPQDLRALYLRLLRKRQNLDSLSVPLVLT